MIYTSQNCMPGAIVVDLDAREKIARVLSVDDQSGEVVCARDPLEVSTSGEIASHTIRFQALWPIFGGAQFPWLFHCHGREVTQ